MEQIENILKTEFDQTVNVSNLLVGENENSLKEIDINDSELVNNAFSDKSNNYIKLIVRNRGGLKCFIEGTKDKFLS